MGHINADFADVSTVMGNKGMALMGTGVASGAESATQAAMEAISSPLLEDVTIDGATGIIINITGSESLTMHETNEAVTLIMEAADEDAEIIFGTIIDDSLEDEIKITVIATGLGQGGNKTPTPEEASTPLVQESGDEEEAKGGGVSSARNSRKSKRTWRKSPLPLRLPVGVVDWPIVLRMRPSVTSLSKGILTLERGVTPARPLLKKHSLKHYQMPKGR